LTAAAVSTWAGCTGKKATEYVPGVSTQVSVPRDLKAIRLEITVGGVSQACYAYQVFDGKVLLPRSLGNYEVSSSTVPVQYTIAGVASSDLNADFFSLCTAPKVGSDQVRVLRRSRQPFVDQKTLFLPMPLKYSCFEKDCPAVDGKDQTCKGGVCVDAAVADPAAVFPPYTPDLVDGTGATCFHAQQCMTSTLDGGAFPASPPVIIDSDKCIYAVAGTPSAANASLVSGVQAPILGGQGGDGVNVQVSYDGGLVHEILDIDPEEGFTIPDPKFPQQFQLAPGLCAMVHGFDATNQAPAHRITAMRASGTCQSKRIDQPLCAADGQAAMGADDGGVPLQPQPPAVCSTVELKPPTSGLVVVVDNTSNNQSFFTALVNQSNNPDDAAIGPAVKSALSDPAFERTNVALVYAPGANTCSTNAAPEIASAPARTARDPILADLKGKTVVANSSADLGAALDRANTELQKGKGYFRRAILVLGTAAGGGFDDAGTCGTNEAPATVAQRLNGPDPTTNVRTFVMQLTTQPPKPASGPWTADLLATAGGSGTAAYKAKDGSQKFEDIVDYLATCVYDVPSQTSAPNAPAAGTAGDKVAFTSPLTDESTSLVFNGSCNAPDAGTGTGWGSVNVPNSSTKRIFLCPDSCKKYRDTLQQTTIFAATYQQPPIPVPVFAYASPNADNNCPQNSSAVDAGK
jgi:hypothetical protein